MYTIDAIFIDRSKDQLKCHTKLVQAAIKDKPTMSNELKITYFSKDNNVPVSALSDKAIRSIVDGIASGIERCVTRGCDVDMFVCIHGNKVLPTSRSIRLPPTLPATVTVSCNGFLRFITKEGKWTLNVVFVGGGSKFVLKSEDADEGSDSGNESNDETYVHGLTQLLR